MIHNLKNRIIRILAILSIVALTTLSLQSLQLRYIELPAYHQAGINAIKKVAAARDKVIAELDRDNLDLISVLNKRNGELRDKDLVLEIQKQAILTQKALTAEATRKVNDLVAVNTINMANAQQVVDQANAVIAGQASDIAKQNAAAQQLLAIIKAEYMPIDQCIVFKVPPCMNGDDEFKGTHDDSACGF